MQQRQDGASLVYIDRHLLHEVTLPQAFEGLRQAGRAPWRSSAHLATVDHSVPTAVQARWEGIGGIRDAAARLQVVTLDDNCYRFGITLFSIIDERIIDERINDERQGIVHVVGPEQGAIVPGVTVVCGDSLASTHGAIARRRHLLSGACVGHPVPYSTKNEQHAGAR